MTSSRAEVERLLEQGETEIEYLGTPIVITDHAKGWSYNTRITGESQNLDEVLDAIEKEI